MIKCVGENMTKKEVKVFLDSHRDFEISAAKLEYSLFLYKDKDIEREILNSLGEQTLSEVDIKIASLISEATNGEELLRLMRKQMSGLNRYNLRQKLLANEDIVISLIKEKSLSNMQDYFIENALYFFLRCKTNVSNWFVENYEHFKSEYLKSMFCLILGFRGDKELIPFLINEAKRFERLYPDETFDQGPTLAVQELACRFLNLKTD